MYQIIKRLADIFLAIALVITFSPIVLLIAVAIKITSKGPILYWSWRVGQENKLFMMPKLRTMKIGTPTVATHLLENPGEFLDPVGVFLRKYSIDEFPQLWSVIKGDMSLVGPRPALFNQYDLINKREDLGIHKLLPGITGWAQINGRDRLGMEEKISFDYEYLRCRSTVFDYKILFMTILKVIQKEDIAH